MSDVIFFPTTQKLLFTTLAQLVHPHLFHHEDPGGSTHAPIIRAGKKFSPFGARNEAASASYPPNAG